MMKYICCGLLLLSTQSSVAGPTVRVVDGDGNPVESFEIMWHTADEGYSLWQPARDGTWSDIFPGRYGDVVDLIVRADGYATKVQRFEGESFDELVNNRATMTLERGREVRVQLERPGGVRVPDDFVIESYFPQFRWRVRMMWQPVNIRDRKPDWNMLNLRRAGDDAFSMRLPAESDEFFLAFQHPGWLQFCELGPFSDEDLEGDVLRIDLPEPATINLAFDAGGRSTGELPFAETNCMVYWAPDESGGVYQVIGYGATVKSGGTFTLSDLGPGKYLVEVRTKPNSDVENVEGTEINPGRYFERDYVTLESGAAETVRFSWSPFDPDAFHGDARARIAIRNPDGSVPAGSTATISWFDGHYGGILLFEGPIPTDGKIALDGISAKKHRSALPNGPYTVAVDDEWLGCFALEETDVVQDFQFTITPGVGDVAPDITLIDVESQHVSRLRDERGKVVLVEFWGIHCGPCQPAMKKLNEFVAAQPADWHEKVTVLSVSTDADAALVRDHASSRGWGALPHYIAARAEGAGLSDAERDYVVPGIPEAILIDKSGRIAWRGHPMDTTGGLSIEDRIESLLKDGDSRQR